MYELKVKNDRGEELNLTTSNKYNVYKITGLNPPTATIHSSVNATTDGSSVSAVRLPNRNIVIYVAIDGDIEANRINLYKYFPLKKTVTLYFKNGLRDVFIEGVVEVIECDLFTNRQIAQISLICPKPYFKSVDFLIESFGDVSSYFSFPFSIPSAGVEISALTPNQRKSIINMGDVETGVIIELYATRSVLDPIIYNVFAGTHMGFNFTMLANDKIVINTNVGEKSITLIRNGVSYNALGYMTADSSWFILSAGDNLFTYDAENESDVSNLQITFTSSLLYGGV